MPLLIIKNEIPPRVVTMGQSDRAIPDMLPVVENKEKVRVKKMAKDLDKVEGVKVIRKDAPDKQGPIGSDAEKQPAPAPAEDLTLGDENKEKE